jgi:hypothetical protein
MPALSPEPFADIVIHASFQTLLTVAIESVCGDGNDLRPILRQEFAYHLIGSDPIHLRHLDPLAPDRNPGVRGLDDFPAFCHSVRPVTKLFQHLDEHLLVRKVQAVQRPTQITGQKNNFIPSV